MSIISLILTIAILGLIVWFITTLVPMPAPFKNAIYGLCGLFLLLWLLNATGLHSSHWLRF